MIVGVSAKVISVSGGIAVIVAAVGAVPSIGTVARASVGVSATAGAAIACIGIVVIATVCGVAVTGAAGAVIARAVGIAITGAAGIAVTGVTGTAVARAVGVPVASITTFWFLAGSRGIIVMHGCLRHSQRRIPYFTYTAPLHFTARKINVPQRTGRKCGCPY